MRPRASTLVQPYICSAPRFQDRMVPSLSRMKMASWARSMKARHLAQLRLVRFCSGDVAGRREDADDLARLVPIHRSVVHHRRDVPVAVLDLQGIVADQPLPEHPLVALPGLLGLGEVVGEVLADKLGAGSR